MNAGLDFRKILFWSFAALSFARCLLFIAALLGIGHTGALIVTANLPTSPQPFAFADKIFYNTMFICLKDSHEEERCLAHADHTKLMAEPYFLGGIAISHGLSLFLRYPESPYAGQGISRAVQMICHWPGTQSVRISKWPTEEWDRRKNEVYAFNCPLSF